MPKTRLALVTRRLVAQIPETDIRQPDGSGLNLTLAPMSADLNCAHLNTAHNELLRVAGQVHRQFGTLSPQHELRVAILSPRLGNIVESERQESFLISFVFVSHESN